MPEFIDHSRVNDIIDELFEKKSSDFKDILDEYKDHLGYMMTAFSSRYMDGFIDYAFAKKALIAIISYLRDKKEDLNNYRPQIRSFYILILRRKKGLKDFDRKNIIVDFTRFIKDELVDEGVISISSMLYIIFKVEHERSVFFSYDEVTISLLLNMLQKLFGDERNKGEVEANYELIQEALSSPFAESLGFGGLELRYLFVKQFPDKISVDTLMVLFHQACQNISTPAHKLEASNIALFCCKHLMTLDGSQNTATVVDMFEMNFLPAMLSFSNISLDETLLYYFRFKLLSANPSKMLTSHPLIKCLIRGGLAPEIKVQLVFLLLVTGSLSDDAKQNLWQDKNLADGLFKFVIATHAEYGGVEAKQYVPFFIQWLFLSFVTSDENRVLDRCAPQTWKAMRGYRAGLLLALCNALAGIEHKVVIAQASSTDKEKHRKMLTEGKAFTGERIASLNERRLYELLDDSFARLGEQGCDELPRFYCSFFTEQTNSYKMVLLSHAFFSTLIHALENDAIPPAFAVLLGANPAINERVYQHVLAHMLDKKNVATKIFLYNVLRVEGRALYHFFSGSPDRLEYFEKALDDLNKYLEKDKVASQKQTENVSLTLPDQLDESDVDDEEWDDNEDQTMFATAASVLPMQAGSNVSAQREYHILGLQDNCCVNLAIPEMLAAITYFASKESIHDYVADQQMDAVEENYNMLKEAFALYYELQADALTWGAFNQLLTQTIHSNLLVAQVILGPVFRCFMQKSGPADYKVDELIYQLQEDGRYCSLDMENASYYLYEMLGINIVSHERVSDDAENDQVKSHSNSSFFATVNVYNTSARQHWQRGEETFTLDRDSRDSMDRAYPSALTYLDGASSQNQVAQVQEVMDIFKREVNKSCQALLNPARASQVNAGMFATDDMPLPPPPPEDMLLQQQQP